MGNLTRERWPKGWRPSDDYINGDPQGLLRMDNLHLDEEGVISLVGGTVKVNPTAFGGDVRNIYSKQTGNAKNRWAALSTGEVLRTNIGDFSDAVTPITGGSVNGAQFGTTNGYTLISSGNERVKDDGTLIYALGIDYPSGPMAAEASSQPIKDIMISPLTGLPVFSRFSLVEGANLVTDDTPGDAYVQWDMDSLTASGGYGGRGSVRANLNWGTVLVPEPTDTGVYGEAQPEDTFSFNIRIGLTDVLEKVQVQFDLVEPDDDDVVTDYYLMEWINSIEGTPFVQGMNTYTNLSCYRKDFVRAGNNPDATWATVYGLRITITGSKAFTTNLVNDIYWKGGPQGKLNGFYEYMQVNVHRNGNYEGRAPMGPTTGAIFARNASISLTPETMVDPQINEIWVYRRSVIEPGFESLPAKLNRWYRVAVRTDYSAFVDNVSDDDALLEGTIYYDQLISIKDMHDEILGIETDFFGRTVYMTLNDVYFSDISNPDSLDSPLSLHLTQAPADKNIWIKKVGNGVLYIGTSKDIFEVTGTLEILPNGQPNMYVRPLGIGPQEIPISDNAVVSSGVLYYIAASGARGLSGNDNVLISEPLNRLFEGYECHGISPVNIVTRVGSEYPIALGKHRLWFSVPLQDSSRRLFVFSLKSKYWYSYYIAPICLFVEEDDTILGGFGVSSGAYIRELDSGDSLDGTDGQLIHLRTIAEHDGTPRNRKDPFTFRIKADTGNENITIALAKDGSNQYYSIGTISFDGPSEKMITTAETIGPAKYFSVKITGTSLKKCKIYSYSIEYDIRPEQLTYIRIPYTNLNTQSRKRFINYAFMIDTLGVDCEFFPLIDGAVAGPSSVFSLDRKGTHVHYFDTEQVGTDIGGIICGFFEFYGPNLDEIISEKMPAPTTFLVIPQDDYGIPNRKRHSSYKFIINTKGYQVRFTPRLDGVNQTPLDFSTSERQVVEYFFTSDTIAINIGGTLQSINNPKIPFEFYGPIRPQDIEVLPPRLKEFRIPENNYGIASWKRIRTMPMEINTNGYDVTFTPIVDNVPGTPTILNTSTRQTAFHYFDTDIFGIDFSGELVGSNPFEFYGLMKPESVEVLPVPKKFDQLGPLRFDEVGKLLALRLRIIPRDSTLRIKILNELDATIPNMITEVGEITRTIPVVPYKDDVYEILMPKTVKGTIFRFEIGPTVNPFHRYDLQVRVNLGGMQGNPKWVKVL